MFSRASACPRQITCKVSKRVVQVSWAPTHANSMALLVPVYSVATRFHFLVLLQKSYWVLKIDFLQLSLESDSVGNGACCLCSWVRSWALNSQTLICWIHSLLGSSQERGCSGCSTRTHVVEVEVRNFALIEGTGLTPYLQSKRGTQQKHHPPHPGITNGPPDLVLEREPNFA